MFAPARWSAQFFLLSTVAPSRNICVLRGVDVVLMFYGQIFFVALYAGAKTNPTETLGLSRLDSGLSPAI